MKKKILFVYDMKLGTPWKDGLWAALNLLGNDFEIKKMNLVTYDGPQIPFNQVDLMLGWGIFDSAVDEFVFNWPDKRSKKGLCIAGTTNPPNDTSNDYDILFYETEWQKKNQLQYHLKTMHAFGVNTDIFYPEESPKLWDYIGVGALASWKRWNYMLKKTGRRLVVGHYQDDNKQESDQIVQELIANDVMVSNEVKPEDLADLYRASKVCYIPGMEIIGGERAILEARACGIGVEIAEDNTKLQSILTIPVTDHHYYYQQLKKGIESVL